MAATLLGVLVLQAAALLAQSVLAALALAGAGPALGLHMAVGGLSLLLAVVQAGAAFLLWRQGRGPSWLFGINLTFLVADLGQMAAGGAHLLTVHLPLGVALFGAAVALAIQAKDMVRSTGRWERGARAVT